MKLTVAGSGTAAPEAARVCSGYFVQSGQTTLLLDCGPGVVHHLARFDLPWRRLDHLFVTHFHNDHIGDIPMLLFGLKWGSPERRTAPLTLWGPRGLRDRLDAMAAAMGDHVADPAFPLDVREIGPGETVEAGSLRVRSFKTPHTDESLAYRVEDPPQSGPWPLAARAGTAIGYTGDTGPSEEVADVMAGVDVLIAECSLPDDDAIPTHLSPSSLAAMATAARPGLLLVAHVYPWLDERGVVELVKAAGWGGETARAVDGMEIEIG